MCNKIKSVSLNNQKNIRSKNKKQIHNSIKNKNINKNNLYLVKNPSGYKIINPNSNKNKYRTKNKEFLKFNFKFLKKVSHAFRQKSFLSKKVSTLDVNLLRFITFYKTYKIRKKFFFFLYGKFKQLKKKKNLKVKLFLWKSLTNINNIKEKINRYEYNSWNKLNFKSKNHYNFKKGKKVTWKIFKNFTKLFRNRFNIEEEKNKAFCVKKEDLLLDSFYYLRKCNIDYYNKYFIINFNLNYFLYFYNVIKSNIVLKMLDTLKIKNYWSYVALNNRKINFIFKAKKLNYVDRNNNNSSRKMSLVLNKFAKQSASWTKFLMLHKKWTRNSIYPWTLLLLKKMIAINVKINVYFNEQQYLYFLPNRKNYQHKYNVVRRAYLDKQKLKIPKYWILFFNYLKKSFVLRTNIVKRYQSTNFYNLKKYFFFFNFIKHYLLKLFNCLKYIFFLKKSNIQFYMYKLKFIMFIMLNHSFLKNIYIKKKKKVLKRVLKLKKNVYLIKKATKFFFYNYILRSYKSKIKKKWHLKMQDPVLNMLTEEGSYIQPFINFKYNPKWNKKYKNKKIFKKLKSKNFYNYLLPKIKKLKKKRKKYLLRKKKIKKLKKKRYKILSIQLKRWLRARYKKSIQSNKKKKKDWYYNKIQKSKKQSFNKKFYKNKNKNVFLHSKKNM